MSVKMKVLVLLGILSIYLQYDVNGNAIRPFSSSLLYETLDCEKNETTISQVVNCFTTPCNPMLKCVEKSAHLCSQYKPCMHNGVCKPQDDGDFKCTCQIWNIGRYCENFIILP
ncbi:hypothetical protein SNE40_000886 [Patella caerulea]|uniref:EGF-like domain-containing protein n=1 Tax=Patella caerulea TaxID=87958 RepID=A0AAN8KI37_PATCE